jgi:hypothetical protein
MAKLSVIFGHSVQSQHQHPLKSAMIGLIADYTRADVAMDCYCPTCFGHGLLKYLCYAAAGSLVMYSILIDNAFNRLIRDPRVESSDKMLKYLARE